MITQVAKPNQFRITSLSEIVEQSRGALNRARAQHQYKTFWTYAVNLILALWLITSPYVYNYGSSNLVMSDTISGVLIILFEALAFSPRRFLLRWLTPVVGLWLLFAPLVFWSPSPAGYLIDTLVGCLVIALSMLIPGTPGQAGIEKPGPDQPPGWTYNPSSWIRRWLGIALALVGFFISRYLAARQLGYFPHAWDPFFDGGTDKVLHSVVSRSFPISDAGFGGVAYMLEVLAGFMGDRARWRTSPWVVTIFGLLVVPLGITSIVLVILQPTIVGHWCGLCLIAAAGLLASVPLAVHELIAMGQFMLDAKKQGKNLSQLFWLGGGIIGGGKDDPDRTGFSVPQRWVASVQGVTVPFTLIAQIGIGAWLMARPDLIAANTATANCDHLLGAVAVTVAAVATAEVTRIARLGNVLVGALLMATAFLFARDYPTVLCSELIAGVALILTSIQRGEIIESYAAWNRFVK